MNVRHVLGCLIVTGFVFGAYAQEDEEDDNVLVVVTNTVVAATVETDVLSTWIGPAAPAGTAVFDAANWDTGIHPLGTNVVVHGWYEQTTLSNVTEYVTNFVTICSLLVDGNDEQDSNVSYAITTTGTKTNGNITVSAGDSLVLRKNVAGSISLLVGEISNAGNLQIYAHASGNTQNTTVTASSATERENILNTADGILRMTGFGNYNRTQFNVHLSLPQINEGTLFVEQPGRDRNYTILNLRGSGVFKNDGDITIRFYGSESSYGSSYSQIALTETTANSFSSFLGSGRVLLTMEDKTQLVSNKTAVTSYVSLTTSSDSHIVTNGIDHTIEGQGTVQFGGIVNEGLVRAVGEAGGCGLLVRNRRAYRSGESYRGQPFINTENGRIIAISSNGMLLGCIDAGYSQLKNYGLLEARTNSYIRFTQYASSSTSALTTYLQLWGTIAGGGTFTNEYRSVLLGGNARIGTETGNSVVVAPGNLTNDDGTGESTVGTLTFVTSEVTFDVSTEGTTTLDFQLGKADNFGVDGNYDKIIVDGALVLAGTLKLTAVDGFGGGGEYTVIQCTPGELTDNGLVVEHAQGMQKPVVRIDPEAGTVTLFFPPLGTRFIVR